MFLQLCRAAYTAQVCEQAFGRHRLTSKVRVESLLGGGGHAWIAAGPPPPVAPACAPAAHSLFSTAAEVLTILLRSKADLVAHLTPS